MRVTEWMTSTIDRRSLIAEVAARAGIDDQPAAELAIHETLAAMAASLSRIERAALADELPAELAQVVRAAPELQPGADPFARLARREGVAEGLAVEYAHVVCQQLAARLGSDLRTLLGRRLQPPWSELFHPRAAPSPRPAPPHRAPAAGGGRTLASARPGSQRPVSESAAVRTQSGSVAASDRPHADTKLSTGVPHGEPVSTAHPADGRRHISEAD